MTQDDIDARKRALADHLGHDDDIEDMDHHSGNYGEGIQIEAEGNTQCWLVCTDAEADDAWGECLDGYIDECVLPELPEMAQRYFDREAWKRDARHDGRGHALSSYDGAEEDITDPETGTNYVAFRVW